MLDTRRKSMVEQRKQRKSQLNSRFSGNVPGAQYPGDRHSWVQNSMNQQQPPQYQMESDYGIDNPSFEPIGLDEEYNRRMAQQTRVTFA